MHFHLLNSIKLKLVSLSIWIILVPHQHNICDVCFVFSLVWKSNKQSAQWHSRCPRNTNENLLNLRRNSQLK